MPRNANLRVGVVVIGRNEGARLEKCLQSLVGKAKRIVYVDSGSTDHSIELATSLGISVISLDIFQPFTMARGRNAGLDYLLECEPEIQYIQFVDGDCEVIEGWLDKARSTLDEFPEVAVVCGRRRERFPDNSIYNRLCDMEWNSPIGEAKACGGDAMIRIEALRDAGKYNQNMIAGEEPELCLRIRMYGWKILRLDAEMTIHDADILKLSQFWKRAIRSGYAYAEGAFIHAGNAEHYKVRNIISATFWGGILPSIMVLCFVIGLLHISWLWFGTLILLTLYVIHAIKIYQHRRACEDSLKHASLYALFCVIGKMPEFLGIFTFGVCQARGRPKKLIEYKSG